MYENPVIHKVQSDCYGAYNLECVGIIDFLAICGDLDLDFISEWMEKFHPKNYFYSYTLVLLHDHARTKKQTMRGCRAALFVATDRINRDWCAGARRSGHYKGRTRKLPICIQEAKIIKWQDSIPGGMLKPEWLKDCKTVEDIKAMDSQHNPGPCRYCFYDEDAPESQ